MMFITANDVLLLLLIIPCCSVSPLLGGKRKSAEDSPKDTVASEKTKRQKALDGFADVRKAVQVRVRATALLFPLQNSFKTSLEQLYDDMMDFFKNASIIGKLDGALSKARGTIEKSQKTLNGNTFKTSTLKDQIEAEIEKINNRFMMLENDISQGNATKSTENEIKKLIKACNNQLDQYVKSCGNLFDEMSSLRHDLVGFGQKIIRSLSENDSLRAMTILEDRFCKSKAVQNYKATFTTIKTAFGKIKSEFKPSDTEPYPGAFVSFLEKILDFQDVKFNELNAAMQEYKTADGVSDKYKAVVALSLTVVDFDYLYDLSKHLISLYDSINTSKNADADAGSPVESDDQGGDSNDN